VIFVAPALDGDATQIEIHLQTATVGLFFTTSTGKKTELTNLTMKAGNARTESARHCRARNPRVNARAYQ
jgi:hypothetical protein